jgi:hypothetical protein
MIEISIKYKDEQDRIKKISFIKKESHNYDIDIVSDRSVTNRILLEIDPDMSDSFISYSKYKGFKFYES